VLQPNRANRCFFHSSYAIDANYGRDGLTPHNARDRKAALVGSRRMSAAMEAAMARRLDAFAMPEVHLIVAEEVILPRYRSAAS